MINLKLSGRLEENVRIEKDNKIKIINYDKYIDFYTHFYKRNNLYIENKEITKKDCIFIDASSMYSIISEMQFKKGTLLYEYVSSVYNNIDVDIKDEFYQSFVKQVEIINDLVDNNMSIIPEDAIEKVVLQNAYVEIENDKLIEEFVKILNYVISGNINLTYIVFYNSQIMNIEKNYDNCYTFDLNNYLDIRNYNLIIVDEIREFRYEILVEYLKNIWPIDYIEEEEENLIAEYFNFVIYLKKFITQKEKLFLMSKILNKEYKIKQEIECNKLIFDSIIKSFVDNM